MACEITVSALSGTVKGRLKLELFVVVGKRCG